MITIKIGPHRDDLLCVVCRYTESPKSYYAVKCKGVQFEYNGQKLLRVSRETRTGGDTVHSYICCGTGLLVAGNLLDLLKLDTKREYWEDAIMAGKERLIKAGIDFPVNEWMKMED